MKLYLPIRDLSHARGRFVTPRLFRSMRGTLSALSVPVSPSLGQWGETKVVGAAFHTCPESKSRRDYTDSRTDRPLCRGSKH